MSRKGDHPAPDAPAHIVDTPGAARSRCGIKDPLPVIWAPFIQAHINGYGLALCPDCAVGGWPEKAVHIQ